MGHQHHWRDKPPEGRLFFNKTFDERYGDEEDMAHNSHWTSPEELQRLRVLVQKDPGYETSSNWPMLVEWCTSCSITRLVRLVLPAVESEVLEARVNEEVEETDCNVEEEKASCEATAQDASTQTPRSRRRGGKGSRRRRLLAFQLMLTEKKGLPLSRLLSLKKADARFSKREELRVQEESASPMLKRRSGNEMEADKKEAEEKEAKVNMEDVKKEEEGCSSLGASSGDSQIFTPRSFHPDVTNPTLNPFPQLPTAPHSFHHSPPSYIWLPHPVTTFFSSPPSGLMPGHQWLICGACNSWGSVS